MNRRTPLRASLIAAALASVAGLAVAADPTPRGDIAALTPGEVSPAARMPAENGYVTDNRGAVVRSNAGDCVTSNTGAAPYGVAECGGILAQATPPVVEPMAVEEPREIPLKRTTLDADTTFNFDSDELSEQGREQLDTIVEAAKSENVARLRIHVTGYADRIGPEEYNKDLSERRAEAVREYFVENELPAEVITSEGRGEANPVVQCEGMQGITLVECLRPNRRSEVEFAALERVEPDTAQEEPASRMGDQPAEPWAPGTDTGTPR